MKSKIEKLEIGKVIKSDRFWSAGMIIEKSFIKGVKQVRTMVEKMIELVGEE